MKKLFSLLLAIIFTVSCLVTIPSCGMLDDFFNDTDTTDDQNNNNNNNNNNTQTPATPTEIIKDGKAQYTLVYPDDVSKSINTAVKQLITAVKERTGVTLTSINSTAAKANADANYILIGATPFEETEAAIELLSKKEDAFTIEKANNHVVIAAHFEPAVVAAIEYYIDNLIDNNYDSIENTLKLEEYYNSGTSMLLNSFEMEDLSRYTIVYSSKVDGMRDVALELKASIAAVTDCSLSVRKDTDHQESPYEILVGNTNRYLSHKSYKDGTPLMKYKIIVAKGQIQLLCGGAHSASVGGNAFIDTYLTNPNTSLDTGSYLPCNLAVESIAHKEGTDIRVMTANLLAQTNSSLADGFPRSTERAEIFAKILVDYTPDLIGVQEADQNYHAALLYYLETIKETYGIEYSTTEMKYNGGAVANFIIYRSDKYTLDYQKVELPSYADASRSLHHSVLSSAKFTSKSDPTLELALLSAHWHWEAEDAVVGTPKQKIDADQMAAEYKNIQKLYPNARIFCTGDFNSHRFKNQYFNEFLAAINGEVASTIAKNNGVLIPSFQHYTPKQYIDHVIGAKGTFDVLYHAGTNNFSKLLTDHQPVYADIKFTK